MRQADEAPWHLPTAAMASGQDRDFLATLSCVTWGMTSGASCTLNTFTIFSCVLWLSRAAWLVASNSSMSACGGGLRATSTETCTLSHNPKASQAFRDTRELFIGGIFERLRTATIEVRTWCTAGHLFQAALEMIWGMKRGSYCRCAICAVHQAIKSMDRQTGKQAKARSTGTPM